MVRSKKHNKFGSAVCRLAGAFAPCLCCSKGHNTLMCSRGMDELAWG